jgi:hypothetical protein
MIGLRRQILRALQRLLHLLCVFVDAHPLKIAKERRFPNRRLPRSYDRIFVQPLG